MTATPITKILVGVDGSIPARNALRWAGELAAATGAHLDVVTTWSIPTSFLMPIVGGPVPPMEVFEEAARTLVAEEVAAVEPAVAPGQHVVFGPAGATLTERSSHYDLVVIGRTGRGRLSRMLLGSTARNVAAHAVCPVAIIGDHDGPFADVTVAVDGSPNSIGALRWAAQLPDAKLTCVYAHDERVLEELQLDHELRTELAARAERALDEAIDTADIDPDIWRSEVRSGDPRTMIIDAVDDQDLLVIGGLSEGFVARVIGSLASYAVEHTAGALVVWRPAAETTD